MTEQSRFLRAIAAAAILAASPAIASDRWEEAGSGAVALLPAPQQATGIISASLYCVEQRWGFLFRAEGDALPAGKAAGTIAIAENSFPIEAEASSGSIRAAVPVEILVPLKEATRMAVTIGEGNQALRASFGLRGSRVAIEAIAPRCSQVDMTGYDRVAFSEAGPDIEAARTLLAEEIAFFRDATTRQPTIATASLAAAEGRKLLFASLCGSTSYFGESGCNLTGYADIGPAGEWQQVYNTEGVNLFTDPKGSNGGWPTLVTLPVVNGLEPSRWIWSGSAYELLEQVMAEEDVTQEEGDSAE